MVNFLQHSPIVDAERNAREVMQVIYYIDTVAPKGSSAQFQVKFRCVCVLLDFYVPEVHQICNTVPVCCTSCWFLSR